MTDVNTLACTVFGEARGESHDGKVAIANVVMNRVANSVGRHQFGDGTVSSACLAPWQFSCWNKNDPNRSVIQSADTSDPVFAECLDIATAACAGTLDDITNGATFYYVNGSPMPSWAVGQTPCAQIGKHLFFSDIS